MRGSKKRSVAVTGSWLPLSLNFLKSRACAELSPHGAKLLLDVLSMLGPNATRNGDIALAPSLMAIRGWTSRATLGATVRELVECGLLVYSRRGGRLDCSLFACTLFPLDCDLRKIDIKPGAYLMTDYMGDRAELANAATEAKPACWRRARGGVNSSPATERQTNKTFRGGTNPTTGTHEAGDFVPPRNKTPSIPPSHRSATGHLLKGAIYDDLHMPTWHGAPDWRASELTRLADLGLGSRQCFATPLERA